MQAESQPPGSSSRTSDITSNPYLLLLPFFAFLLLFWIMPLLGGLRSSLLSNGLYGPSHFVGLEHYKNLLQDSRYAHALKNTLLFTASSILLIIPLALLLAHLVRASLRPLRPLLTFLLLLPGLTPPAVIALLFLLVFHGREGLLNHLVLLPLGFNPINWLKDPQFILPALVLQSLWRWTGFITFFILAGLEGIPRGLYEAARLTTNNPWHLFRFITFPMLKHVLLFAAVYLMVDAFSLFSGAYVLLGGSGGTADAGLLLISYTYQQAFTFGNFGTAAAISISVAPLLMLALWACFIQPRPSRST